MGLTIECEFHVERRARGQKVLRAGTAATPALPAGRVPRIARLMALAIRFDGLLRSGEITSYSELAVLGHVTRARISQVMNLLQLAPDIQEEILYLPRTLRGRDPMHLAQLQLIAYELKWRRQRPLWRLLYERYYGDAILSVKPADDIRPVANESTILEQKP